jgi:crotonobetainyl-CoA:carnitine CoA-transferase CaiB-like acyl-CoA transferase
MQVALPLSGLLVVEIGTSVAGPFAGQILADLGADVVKIENPQGGDDARNWGPPFERAALASEASGQRGDSISVRAGHSPEQGSSARGAAPVFNAINRNKRSAAIDLKDETQRAALRRFILDEADVVVQNLRPGLLATYGLDAETLCAAKPSLIYCNLAAYGADGPLKNRPGYDPLMQAFGGLMSLTGEDGREPVRTGPSIIDQGSAMWAVIGILSALHRRAATGQGCEVGTSLYETALAWTNMHAASYLASGRVPRRMGSENFGICPYKAYQARDGWVVVAAGNNNLFQRLADSLGHPEWIADARFKTNPDRVTNRDELNPLVAAAIAIDTVAAWVEKLGRAAVPCAPVLDLAQVMAHPQFAAVGMLQDGPDGTMPMIGTPLQFDGERPPFRAHPPALGEHSDAVLGPPPRRKASS